MTENGTTKFTPVMEGARDAGAILNHVYRALQAKGYDPVTQLVGYLISGDPTYITSYGQARSMICRLERDEIMEELVQGVPAGAGRLTWRRVIGFGCGRRAHRRGRDRSHGNHRPAAGGIQAASATAPTAGM